MAATTTPSNTEKGKDEHISDKSDRVSEKGNRVSEESDYASEKGDCISAKANSISDKGSHNSETDSDPSTIWCQVKAADRFWAYKSAIRALQCLVALIGLCCAAWILKNTNSLYSGNWIYSGLPHFDDFRIGTVAVPIFVLSLTWGLLDLGVRFWRKQGRPTHPAAVAVADLLFWLTMIVAIVYATIGVARMQAFGYDANGNEVLSDETSYISRAGIHSWGQYHRNADLDLWLYTVKRVHLNQERLEWNLTTGQWSIVPYTGPMFLTANYDDSLGSWVLENGTVLGEVRACKEEYARPNCEELDMMVNDLWLEKPTHVAVGKVIAVMASLALILHFALFARASVEAIRRRREEKIEKLRADAKFELEGKDYEEEPDWMLNERGYR
ncbi:hypothetical protein MGG_02157 [Pyricularia oryzae 70-15]|uniref:Uncharacterized protein n=3 Tax=Pyricularia oryzae TaxID=318829 RepID=G4MP58_PYRO7|nr:uncharacterized protein MGG_02157 [Pyricularia oryzae 70-15]EHA56317.1 hypothetical protein MGG_02157 [Pyricularia oryzae 70-15]ELQ35974.1 hypothetical protein OOU_Y34scaffold00675g5 [Pyricularia oryzae Y34]KAI7910539.1 hypothetical protein M9X92_011043 [Pyricularia oryzae]KAI7911296.1 hypothetical protein M0657_011032 [Pyricularia oryzae]